MWENAQETCSRRVIKYQRIFLGGLGCLPCPLEHLHFAILGKIKVFWEGGESTPKNSLILITFLEHVFGAFSHINPSEPFHLGIAHFYRGISSQKQGCARGRARSLQNTIFVIFHLYGSYLGYHNIIPAFVENWPPLIYIHDRIKGTL